MHAFHHDDIIPNFGIEDHEAAYSRHSDAELSSVFKR
jgi:hypothetical protein